LCESLPGAPAAQSQPQGNKFDYRPVSEPCNTVTSTSGGRTSAEGQLADQLADAADEPVLGL